jgi:hypothetical protein
MLFITTVISSAWYPVSDDTKVLYLLLILTEMGGAHYLFYPLYILFLDHAFPLDTVARGRSLKLIARASIGRASATNKWGFCRQLSGTIWCPHRIWTLSWGADTGPMHSHFSIAFQLHTNSGSSRVLVRSIGTQMKVTVQCWRFGHSLDIISTFRWDLPSPPSCWSFRFSWQGTESSRAWRSDCSVDVATVNWIKTFSVFRNGRHFSE